jgi:hypothetical protein
MKINEIATVGRIGTVGGATSPALSGSTLTPPAAKPVSAGSTTAANTAPVTAPTTTANAAPTTGSSAGSTQPAPKPISTQGVDALAQLLKSAGLNSAQLGQIMQKAK